MKKLKINASRPSGRLLVHQGKLYRFTKVVDPLVVIHQVMDYEITAITPESYSEKVVQKAPVVMSSGSSWNGQALPQFDPVQVNANSWVTSVDGFRKYWLFGCQY